ncbi:hypothetical protein SHI21_15925 [Bacteriovorax sp. PP10]|uniref:Uncharacterized protein n=1 Tax=Bacteriovorax antarcticus TaxID=3088717 RepID=A0ABU5VZG7_9BACT|nr:hypothetical protein [Bacteriovorax sp. PP10]MEA9357719.1 hypothetical protein [Bacteriovorax sp. PP10]
MKSLIAILALAVTANVFAYSVTDSSVLTSAAPFLSSATTSGSLGKVQANAIINDAQEMLQTGETSSFLSQKIKETQDLNAGASESEALDILIESAQSLLSK